MDKASAEGREVADFLSKYRRTVNQNLLFVSVDLSGRVSAWVFWLIQRLAKNHRYFLCQKFYYVIDSSTSIVIIVTMLS